MAKKQSSEETPLAIAERKIADSLKQSLSQLDLSSLGLTELPESLGELKQLQNLSVWRNQLTELPESLRKLTSLRYLLLHGNEELGLPNSILGPTAGEARSREGAGAAKPIKILEHYFRLRGGSRPLNEAKLILVGRGGAGKTSLVKRLVEDKFRKGERKTEGIRITEWPIAINRREKIRLNIWDFGGQEIMHATHQFFLTERSLYLLVLNGREGDEDRDADRWLTLIESFGGDSPVIVVLNKIKEHAFDLNRGALEEKFPNRIKAFIKTDCAEGTGIKDVKKTIRRELDQLEHHRTEFPASWFEIKDSLAGMAKKKENYLSYTEYQELCVSFGEKDPKAQDVLAQSLHDLGIALNYKDDPRLRFAQVLNPRWVTNGIYKILNSKKLEAKQGEIRLTDLRPILSNKYPADMRQFLLDLMERFKLCFRYEDDRAKYLIPELLDKQQPEEASKFKREECLNFEYHYPVLPEGLLPQFIVRTHILSDDHPRWRTGVILSFEGCLALVKGDVQGKKVYISIKGSNPDRRRRLLAVIRDSMGKVYADISSLKPLEMVPLLEDPKELIRYKELLEFEKARIESFPRLVKGKTIHIHVRTLLNGVDLEGLRAKHERRVKQDEPVRIFFSYDHEDDRFRKTLWLHLTPSRPWWKWHF